MTSPERAQRVAEIVKSALEREPQDTPRFLNESCAGDKELRAEVESLLKEQEGISRFIEEPALHFAAETFVRASVYAAGQIVGNYEILSLIARGGMGEVYLAQDRQLQRKVALKLIRGGMDSADLVRHFKREERLLASLNHPNIAQLYGGGVNADRIPFFAMEYVEGQRLDEHCDNCQLAIEERLQLFRKVCAAVTYAHQHLVIHRDIKPANIRVTPEGEPKLLDFGIAKLLQTDTSLPNETMLTFAGAMTPDYASPEQVRGEAVATTSDIYSLGVLLYKLLTGQSPYRTKTKQPNELARAITDQDPERPSTAVANNQHSAFSNQKFLKGDLDNIVLRAMRKEPERRYASVGQFSEDIRRHLEGLPVAACKDTVGYRASKFVRRHKAGVAAAALVLLALLGGLVTTTWQTRIARQERDHARVAQRQAERMDDFLQSLLRSADPAKMGKDVKVVQVLDAASKSMDHDLAAEPEVLAHAHESISFTYGQLGQVQPAEEHIRAALEIRRRIHSPDDPATLKTEMWLAGAFCNRAEWQAAEPLLRHVLAVRSRQNPPDLYWLARTNEVLGSVLSYTNRPEEGLIVLQKALADLRALRGEGDTDYIHVLVTLGLARMTAGQLEQAEVDQRRAIELSDQRAPHGFYAIEPQLGLVSCLLRQQRLPEAEQAVERLETDSLQLEGSESLEYSLARLLRACVDFEQADYAKVIDEVRHPLEAVATAFPTQRGGIVQARGLLGLALTRTGRAAEGEPFLRAALAEGPDVDRQPLEFTFGNPETALGECLTTQGRYAEAEPLLLTGYNDLHARLGEKHPMSVAAAHRLHQMYLAWDKPAEATRFAAGDNPLANPSQ
ncbi:MAG: protein kinase [Chthoniobacterales bacterium]|nr:protein kinase [Chthoniobacterales bacterium]